MTWTYAANFTLTKDKIRLRIGDVEEADPLLSDEEIAQAYSDGGSVLAGAVLAARWAAAKLARSFDKNLDGLSTNRSQRHAQMLAIIAQLEHEQTTASLSWSVPTSISKVTDSVRDNYPLPFQVTDTETQEWGDDEE